ncbi:MAG: UDP-N-acetylmuramate dehydrogenase [Gammaproteobacteria bacterium]|nr:UDP-N-acetylmuramate dehydrogenase [Gammaproteobacteria bacterium]
MSGLRGEWRSGEPMSRHTSWRVGGPAEHFYLPVDADDLAMLLLRLPAEEPLTWIGLGSNLLVRDGGIRGTVICTAGMLGGMERTGERQVRVEAGVPCAKLARFCARAGLCGTEFLAGIPGTVGGALAMNAGANGGEIWNFVQAVETLDRGGQRHLRQAREYQVGYRLVRGPGHEWFIAARLQLATGSSEQAQQLIKDMLARRTASQPTGQSSCGSVFRNPPGDYAGRLIEACGLKGTCIGGACVSEKHANFIVNTGSATAADIENLIQQVMQTVMEQQQVRLIPEVHIVGDSLSDKGVQR